MNRAIKRLLIDVVLLDGEQDAAPSLEDMARRAKALLDEPKAKRRRVLARSLDRRKEEKAETAKERTHRHWVYSQVDDRSQGMCELGTGLLDCHSVATDHDHFWGRGKAKETPENVWHLCRVHHREKTDNYTSRRSWLLLFQRHCIFKGFRAEAAKVDRALALETAQYPR